MSRRLVVAFLHAVASAGCTSTGTNPADDCTAAGGQCVFGNEICANPGSQTCRPNGPGSSYCCLSNVADCGQPDATTYACPDAASGGPSCHGDAPPPPGILNFDSLLRATDPDASHPAGCKVTFPGCNGPNVPYCMCNPSSGFSGWSCFY